MELKKNKGYSLIELTIVVGLTSILAIAIAAIMMSSLLSSTRIRTAIKVRQTGDQALSQLQQLIRNARAVDLCVSDDPTPENDYLIVTGQDGNQTTIETEEIATGYYRIASSSAITTYYLNTDDTPASAFNLTCLPSDAAPTLVRVSFTLTNSASSARPFENPNIIFETSAALRNQ